MRPDSKQKVLLALYTEYQKDLPEFTRLDHEALGLSRDVFNYALKKLLDEEFIENAHLIWGEDRSIPLGVVLDVVKLTPNGIRYIEELFALNRTLPGRDKVRAILTAAGDWDGEPLLAWIQEIFREL
ncbi:Bacteriophage Tuc2009, YjcQ [Acididesulfobacillus acetoxydans]|uniref:Bacteriophage Tuc2009, YjcQ n=1 Tax=Acididesulfobacillus acetoxydans TaxID=1561005 RepID=A0A8S0WM17_9FIRM|nr:YjcQ family protein [Acididesulfobacillus acetoxydans]CAA7600314.1 Bacteriophage Tuc2009, YjcQ [Acididesulfobacillus acetoxydans]CEJ06090.1 Hypothetical protein DEACI_0536 [Acididesulfobacillus acetoxydans]